jgi:hypothetical protein
MMVIDAPYPLSTISKLGALSLLVVGNGDQCPLLFLSTFSKFEGLDFLAIYGLSSLISPRA